MHLITPWTDECPRPTLTLWIWPGFPFPEFDSPHWRPVSWQSRSSSSSHPAKQAALAGLEGYGIVACHSCKKPMTTNDCADFFYSRLKLTVPTSEAMLVNSKSWLLMVSDLQPKSHTWANSWPMLHVSVSCLEAATWVATWQTWTRKLWLLWVRDCKGWELGLEALEEMPLLGIGPQR